MNTHYPIFIAAFWIIFWIYWFVSAFNAKQNRTGSRGWQFGAAIRILIFIVVLVLLRNDHTYNFFLYPHGTNYNVVGLVGVIMCGLGIALAIWARLYLGRNWGMPMSDKVNPEFVTSGPYAIIRHPIYTGVLLAMLGSALTLGIIWIIFFVLFFIYFIYATKVEERMMTQKFPDQYPQYKKRTKALIPYIY